MDDVNQPLVIDNGSGTIKAGFAGSDRPQVSFFNCVGRPKASNVLSIHGGKLEGLDFVVGSRVREHRGILTIHYPMEHGIIRNWEDMERVWAHVYAKVRCLVRHPSNMDRLCAA
jgi:centractin